MLLFAYCSPRRNYIKQELIGLSNTAVAFMGCGALSDRAQFPRFALRYNCANRAQEGFTSSYTHRMFLRASHNGRSSGSLNFDRRFIDGFLSRSDLSIRMDLKPSSGQGGVLQQHPVAAKLKVRNFSNLFVPVALL
jgi:hypothetical protein